MEAIKYKVEISGPLLSLIYESLWESASIRVLLLHKYLYAIFLKDI